MLMETLDYALSRKRPHGGKGEEQLARYVELAFPGQTTRDACGNVHLDLRTNTGHRTLFVAHLDTVHRSDGKNKIEKKLTRWNAKDAPLGADDGAGVALLCHLAANDVPAYYIFTRGEEVGGVGSRFLAENSYDLLMDFDRAVAFDRRGIDSVITHQWGGRCASNKFADALADCFNQSDLMYLPDDSGVYTDTAEFTHLIPECTNISCGYDHEHSARETLDILHLKNLAAACLNVDWDALPTARDPSVKEDWFATTELDDQILAGRFQLCEALERAEHGDYKRLVSLMAEAIYPEDVALAQYHLRDFKVGQDLINEAFELMDVDDNTRILLHMYDQAEMAA